MKYIDKKLKYSNVIRVHRSYIVNINKIDSISKEKLRIIETSIPIGVTYQKKLNKIRSQFSKLNR